MEIVTHPMTLQYHMAGMPWGDVASEALRMGYTSHKACTCGLHVHVNRSAFGDTEAEQEEVIARILFFVENHWNERKNNIDPERFISYYQANGWKVGRNQMKDWRAAVQLWERRDSGQSGHTAETPNDPLKGFCTEDDG